MKTSNKFITSGMVCLILFGACNHSKQYSTCEDLATSLKDEPFKDLVKDWGETYKQEYYGPNNEWLCRWHGVGVNGKEAEIHFENIDYSWGANGPFTVRATDCQPSASTPNIVSSNSVYTLPSSVQEKIH